MNATKGWKFDFEQVTVNKIISRDFIFVSLYSLHAKIKMLFFAWLTPVVKTNITRVLHQQYLSPPTTKMYMPQASISLTFYDY